MKLARVKNGFLGDAEGGYRDLKINVVFQSMLKPEVRMICEVQLILNQYLYEKKKMHKLYSIIRDEIYYEMAVKNEEDAVTEQELDLKALQFEQILNVDQEFGDEYGSPEGNQCFCVDMESKKVVFKIRCHCAYAHHWITFENRLFLSIPTKKNVISFFAVDSVSKQLSEDDTLKIVLPESDDIDTVEFDNAFENVFILKNSNTLEKRPVGGGDEVTMTLKLKEGVNKSMKNMSLSKDGKFCAIGRGSGKNMWHLVDIATGTQQHYEMKSNVLHSSFAPCFLGGGSQLIAVGGTHKFEIWNLVQMEAIRVVVFDGFGVNCMCSAGNILAVGSRDQKIRLFDTRSWELVLSKEYKMVPTSLHLSSDLRYLTVGGARDEKCVVLKLVYKVS